MPWKQISGWLVILALLAAVGFLVVRALRPSEEEQRAQRGRAIEQQLAEKFTIRPSASPSPSPKSTPAAP